MGDSRFDLKEPFVERAATEGASFDAVAAPSLDVARSHRRQPTGDVELDSSSAALRFR